VIGRSAGSELEDDASPLGGPDPFDRGGPEADALDPNAIPCPGAAVPDPAVTEPGVASGFTARGGGPPGAMRGGVAPGGMASDGPPAALAAGDERIEW
jgi:hypothetical protein